MKQQEVALVSQIKKSQTDLGNSWEDCMIMARRLHNAFSDEPELDTDIIIDTIWQDAESRNDKEQAETLSIRVEKLGVSEEQAQIEMGYDASQIASFSRAQLRANALNTRRIIPVQIEQDSDEDQDLTQTETEDSDDTARTPAT